MDFSVEPRIVIHERRGFFDRLISTQKTFEGVYVIIRLTRTDKLAMARSNAWETWPLLWLPEHEMRRCHQNAIAHRLHWPGYPTPRDVFDGHIAYPDEYSFSIDASTEEATTELVTNYMSHMTEFKKQLDFWIENYVHYYKQPIGTNEMKDVTPPNTNMVKP